MLNPLTKKQVKKEKKRFKIQKRASNVYDAEMEDNIIEETNPASASQNNESNWEASDCSSIDEYFEEWLS